MKLSPNQQIVWGGLNAEPIDHLPTIFPEYVKDVTVIEKRKVERFDLQLEAFVSLPGSVSQNESESLVTRDISMCGAFLKTDSPLPVGSKVCVDMILTLEGQKKQDARQAWIKASGKVLRTDNEGMAVGFDDQSRILPLSKRTD